MSRPRQGVLAEFGGGRVYVKPSRKGSGFSIFADGHEYSRRTLKEAMLLATNLGQEYEDPEMSGRHLPTRPVQPEPKYLAGRGIALYARVSSAGQREDLNRQLAYLNAFAARHGLVASKMVAEVGSGVDGHRPKLRALLADPTVETIVVARRDRLARVGLEYVEAALAAHGRQLVVVDDYERPDELIQDLTDLLTSLFARLYGHQSARERAEAAVAAASEAQPPGALFDTLTGVTANTWREKFLAKRESVRHRA